MKIYQSVFPQATQKSEPKKDFGKDKRDYPKSVATFPKKIEANSTSGATFSPDKKSGNIWCER